MRLGLLRIIALLAFAAAIILGIFGLVDHNVHQATMFGWGIISAGIGGVLLTVEPLQ